MENQEKIELTLDPFGRKAIEEAAEAVAEGKPMTIDDLAASANLTEEEKSLVAQFSESIDITDTASVLQFGAGSQQKIAEFSDSALSVVRTQDLGEAGTMLANLVGELKAFNGEADVKGLKKLFRSAKKQSAILNARFDKANASVDDIVTILEGHEVTLTKDIAVLDTLYGKNLTNFKELSMYIIAGKQKLEKERSTTLAELQNRAKESNLPEDAQKANDFATMCDRFEKKIYDLELTRMVSLQMGPQIRLVQNNDIQMTEKIYSTKVNTIPLWKSQMLIALGLSHSAEALKAEQAVTNMTNELLKKNAQLIHQNAVEVAKESERGIVDIETLIQTNNELITALDDVKQIQEDGKTKRREAEKELDKMENEVKQKLLEISTK
ncbi:MAG: toxic anion resistance protein [Clostridia bacterium]|nr:toxic anion resistance protein [Clostridia bacterium]